MIVEILTIGREILDGRVIDTNSVYLALKLKELGLIPRFAQKVDDDVERMLEAFELASKRSDLIFVTGGLGPTSDDITAEIFARFLRHEVVLNPEALKEVEWAFKRMSRPFTEVQKKQALLPSGAKVLKNAVGTAPGFSFQKDSQLWFFMPGVPREMKSIFENEILKELPRSEHYWHHSWATQFTSEGELQTRLQPVIQKLPKDFELSFRTRFPENHIGLYAFCQKAEDKKLFTSLSVEISSLLNEDVFSEGKELKNLEDVVFEKLKASRAQLATVESCTGGLIAHRLTEISGSSEVFFGSFITYDNKAKEDLGVKESTLQKHGAVSLEVAKEMAEAGLSKILKYKSESEKVFCLSTTGIAGPSGGSAEKPVGLCYMALAQKNGPTQVHKINARLNLERSLTKLFFSQKALDLLRRNL